MTVITSKNEKYWLAAGPPCSDLTALTWGHQASGAGGDGGAHPCGGQSEKHLLGTCP